MTPGPPVHVQLARLAHSLETVLLHLRHCDYDEASTELSEAIRLVTQIQRDVR